MGIIVVMLIAFFSASFAATVNAQGTENVSINNTTIVNDGSGANLAMNFEIDGIQTDITTYSWAIGSTHTITQLTTTFNDQFQLVANGFQVGSINVAGGSLSYTVTSDPSQSISFTPDVMVGVYVVTNGTGSVSPSGFQWVDLGAMADSGNQVPITATPTSQNQVFVGWTISDVNSAGNGIDDPSASSTVAEIWDYATVTANFYQPSTSTVSISNQAGSGYMNYIVDGQQYSAPQTFSWTQGSIHTISSVTTIKNDGTEKYVPNMIDNGTGVVGSQISYNVDPYTFAVPTYSEDIYMAPNTQYSVNFNVNGQGTINPSTITWVNPWVDETPITATPAVGNTFTGWTSNTADTYFTNASAQSTTVMIGDPSTIITANFAPIPQVNVAITSLTLTPVTTPVGDPSLQNIGVTVNLQNNNYVTEPLNITLYSGSIWMAYSIAHLYAHQVHLLELLVT